MLTDFIVELLLNPDDETTPLVMADWLDDHDEETRAALIRAQAKRGDVIARIEALPACFCHAVGVRRLCDACRDAKQLERELEAFNADVNVLTRQYLVETSREFPGCTLDVSGAGVCRVECPVAAWMEHGPAWVRRHPIQVVRFGDRSPYPSGWEVYWHIGCYPHDEKREIPLALMSLLKGGRDYPRADEPGKMARFYTPVDPDGRAAAIAEAWADASQAAVRWAWSDPAWLEGVLT